MTQKNTNKMQEYTDKYFLRANEILKAEGLNPWVNMQIFVRKGPGQLYGINEAIDIITENSNIAQVGGRIYAKKQGSMYEPKETIMNIIAPIQEIVELETVYLGALTAATTLYNDKKDLNFNKIGRQMRQVADLIGDRDSMYFGARHWHYSYDSALAKLAFENGISSVATDNGAKINKSKAKGTIPHVSENIYAYYYGKENATRESTAAFDRVINTDVPRIALVDYNNKEITDSLACADDLGERLYGVRVDTCGENLSEGAVDGNKKYWQGKGVTVSGVYAIRKALNEKGREDVKIVLSSGFSNPEKIKAFNKGEKKYGLRLYDSIGAGFLDDPRCFTSDVIAVGESKEEVDFYQNKVNEKNIIHKVGRPPRLNKNLEEVLK